MTGPLAGVGVVELGGIGPGPYAGPPEDRDLLHRGKPIIDRDVKTRPHS